MASATPANNHMGLTLVHGWVSTNCGRGTIDIRWSCLFTVFLCVWTAIHLSVPLYRGDKPLSRRDKIVRSKVIPALLSVIAPEFLGYTAMIEFLKARKRVKLLRRLTKTRLSLTHGYFLDMGGICLTTIDGKYHQLSEREASIRPCDYANERCQAILRNGRLSLERYPRIKSTVSQSPTA